jgi:hypothetical protein
MASTEKFSRVPMRHLLKRLGLYVIIVIPGDVCFFFLLRQRPGPDGYVGIQVLFLVVVITYINSSALWLERLLMPDPPTRGLKSDQVST